MQHEIFDTELQKLIVDGNPDGSVELDLRFGHRRDLREEQLHHICFPLENEAIRTQVIEVLMGATFAAVRPSFVG